MTSNSVPAVVPGNPDRRSASRTNTQNIRLRCEGEIYAVEDWSTTGCRVTNYKGELRPGCTELVDLLLFADHDDEALPVIADVVRFEPGSSNNLALHFSVLRPRDIVDYCNRVQEFLAARTGDEVE